MFTTLDDFTTLNNLYYSLGRVQSIGVAPNDIKAWFALENGREPKNPLEAERGLG